MREEPYVFAVRPFRRTRGTAEHSCARDGEDEGTVEGAVAIENGTPPASVDLAFDLSFDLSIDLPIDLLESCLRL